MVVGEKSPPVENVFTRLVAEVISTKPSNVVVTGYCFRAVVVVFIVVVVVVVAAAVVSVKK